ncbi:hypothetical protein GCK72_024482 [Caenorhabditis remanei]|uniref:Uncharacterized protein n=1 Tax=Caenorhabditis remanei TaxID=31234 RepID=A0A6A5FZZ2_CAERE|nr:hypothetical protein GCK72_024482 [Caenorhabditis remanei]KAF1748015.1 hypothetical protein GCK72_024482 [Caenorhabditis remanei]
MMAIDQISDGYRGHWTNGCKSPTYPTIVAFIITICISPTHNEVAASANYALCIGDKSLISMSLRVLLEGLDIAKNGLVAKMITSGVGSCKSGIVMILLEGDM